MGLWVFSVGFFWFFCQLILVPITLQGTNISHLGKRKIIFKIPFLGDMLVPRRVRLFKVMFYLLPYPDAQCMVYLPTFGLNLW